MPVSWPSFQRIVTPHAADQSAPTAASGSGAPGRGQIGAPCSRKPRHSAHGQFDAQFLESPKVALVPSAHAASARGAIELDRVRRCVFGQLHRHAPRVLARSAPTAVEWGRWPDPRSLRRRGRGCLAALPAGSATATRSSRRSSCASFPDAIAFVVRVGFFAERADHHPDLDIRWRNVRVALTTHDAGGLTAAGHRARARASTASTRRRSG